MNKVKEMASKIIGSKISCIVYGLCLLFISCDSNNSSSNGTLNEDKISSQKTFNSDVQFLEEYVDVHVLEEPTGSGLVAVSADLQGRVMTSTATGLGGNSYGWINRKLFESGDTSVHINVFGGEERFWLGPEGGQYSIFFKNGEAFDLDHWHTPKLIDLEPFELVAKTNQSASFSRIGKLTNYSDFTFEFEIQRKIEVINKLEIFQELEIPIENPSHVVAYRSTNLLQNVGEKPWRKETGLLSVWLLGMLNHSSTTVVIIPYKEGDNSELGAVVNDEYFGKVPADRLKYSDGTIYFKADGQYRSKIGLNPSRAKNVLGSYDWETQRLTIVKYNKPEGVIDYVNSMWELQDSPYAGDVINSYNDGPPEPGKLPLGPFYELETSSPALELLPGEHVKHVQQTFHFEGDENSINHISQTVLGVSLKDIKKQFEN